MNTQVKGLLRNAAYDALKAMIITGQLPPGARVTEIDICERLNISRTPVREALNRLARDGLVMTRARNGYAVMPFDAKMLGEAFHLREVLEPCAAAMAAERASDFERASLTAIIDESDRLAALPNRTYEHNLAELQLGIDLHREIACLGGNQMMCDILNGLLDKCHVYIWLELTQMNNWTTERDEHRQIVQAICQGDGAGAADAMRTHIAASRRNLGALMQSRQDMQAQLANRLSAPKPR